MSDKWSLHHGDCIPFMTNEMTAQSVDLVVSSPPFPALYSYSSSPSDMGNTDTMGAEAKVHFHFFYTALARVLKPGRVACIHVCQIPRMKRSGEVGLCDFRGINIRIAERAGLIYEYDWLIGKNPQVQALRTKSRELQFSGLESDRARSRGALADYIIKFRAPGDNSIPVRDFAWNDEELLSIMDDDVSKIPMSGREKRRIHPSQVSRNEWIQWAEAAWSDIRQTDTLNVKVAKGENDTKHICPLQLGLIERLVRLFSNPGELVFDPFNGIASTGYNALKLGRRYLGCELKDEYFSASIKNLSRMEDKLSSAKSNGLFANYLEDDDNLDESTEELEAESCE